MLFLIVLFGVLGIMLLLCLIGMYMSERRDQHKDSLIANHLAQSKIIAQRQIIIDDIKQKILNNAYSSWQKASADLTTLFADEVNHLRLTYPELTDLDICVLQLLGIGLDNYEILTFLEMSKRTFYKRRQLIAGRVGLLASQLDQFAYAHIKCNIHK